MTFMRFMSIIIKMVQIFQDPVEVSKNYRDVDKEKSEASHQQSKVGINLSQFFK